MKKTPDTPPGGPSAPPASSGRGHDHDRLEIPVGKRTRKVQELYDRVLALEEENARLRQQIRRMGGRLWG